MYGCMGELRSLGSPAFGGPGSSGLFKSVKAKWCHAVGVPFPNQANPQFWGLHVAGNLNA